MRGNFKRAIHKTFDHEGHDAYTNDPVDRGGPTKWGLSQRFLETISKEKWPPERIMGITHDDAVALYQEHFWDKCKCDELPEGVDIKTFDIAVNCGTGTAAKILQRAIRSVGNQDRPIKDDGVIGRLTIIAAGLAASGDYSTALLAAMRSEQAGVYRTIVARNPSQERFINGWLRRAYDE